MPSRAVSPVMVAREAELSALAAAYAATPEAPVTVLVSGDAGIGKSRLVHEFIAGAGSGVARVFEGVCSGFGADGLPYAPFRTVLRRLVRAVGMAEVAAWLPEQGRRGLARLLPELGEAVDDSDPDLGRARLFEEILILLERSAEDRPLIVVLEDLHWADRSTGELLVFLLRNLSQPGILLICTYRTDDWALRPVLSRIDGIRRFELGGLSRRGVSAQVTALLGRQPEPQLLDRIFRRSEGNPLFVEALVDSPEEASVSLRDLLLAGADRLPVISQQVLRAAAVAGSHVGHGLLAAVAGLDDLTFEQALRPVVDQHFMHVVDDGYAFRRAMIRDAVYDHLLPGERVRLHTRYAEALSQDQNFAELTAHWYAAGNLGQAVDAAWGAAAAAQRARAYGEQHRMLGCVLQLWDHLPRPIGVDYVQVLEMAAEAGLAAGEIEDGEALSTAALTQLGSADPLRVAAMLEIRAAVRDRLGQDPVPDLSEALHLTSSEAPTPARGRLLASLARALLAARRLPQAALASTEALAIGRRTADLAVQAKALVTLAALAAGEGRRMAAADMFEQASTAAREADAQDTLLLIATTESDTLEAAGDHAAAAAAAWKGIAAARELGLARTCGTLLAPNLAEPLVSLGRWEEAGEIILDALDLAPPPLYRTFLLIEQATVAIRRGDLAGAEIAAAQVRSTVRGHTRGDEPCLESDLLDCRLAQAKGSLDQVRTIIGHALAEHDLALSPRYGWPLVLVGARARVLDGWDENLPAFGELQRAYRTTVKAELARHDRKAWHRAVTAWRNLSEPFAVAEALWRSAEAELAAGDKAGAAAQLREAVSIATELGAGLLRNEIEKLAGRGRLALDPPAAPQSLARPGGLTPRENEVLRLLCAGMSNRQIGEQLFIAAKTAGVHVSNILAKLDVTTRLEAASWAHRNRFDDA